MSLLCNKCLAVKSGDVVIHDLGCDTRGISPAQLAGERSVSVDERLHLLESLQRDSVHKLGNRIDVALKRIEQQDKMIALLLDRVNQLVEFHGIRPIDRGKP